MVRVEKLPPFGDRIDKFMTAFTDHRDSGSLIISHFSLLLGCALPVWLNSGPGDRPLGGYAGVLSLGVLDTFASVIGFNYGKIRVSPNSKKTVEGTLAGVGALLVSVLFVIFMLPAAARPTGFRSYLALVAAATGAGVLEAYTLQLDNAFIPLLFYALLCLALKGDDVWTSATRLSEAGLAELISTDGFTQFQNSGKVVAVIRCKK
ncbi:hypothetical protein R1sor_024645 [Riccia sorocarpa]|uniref:dolichol kinase n=1 Tax=Riccia sorocarpa TaxID=122646 RepID=A0ABD3GTJ0_9MARC